MSKKVTIHIKKVEMCVHVNNEKGDVNVQEEMNDIVNMITRKKQDQYESGFSSLSKRVDELHKTVSNRMAQKIALTKDTLTAIKSPTDALFIISCIVEHDKKRLESVMQWEDPTSMKFVEGLLKLPFFNEDIEEDKEEKEGKE